MKIEMGESLFYSWLRHVKECQLVQTNWKVSPKWTLRHEEELERLMKLVDMAIPPDMSAVILSHTAC